MKVFPHLFAKLFCRPTMLTAPVRYSLERGLLSHLGIEHTAPAPVALLTDNQKADRVNRIAQKFGNVAVISLDGVIDKHISQFEMECYGGCDIADFDNALNAAAADPSIERVVLAINSPGGSVTGVPESAARVARLAQTKEVHAFVDAMACSAAYYIASQADFIAAAPSAVVGSIGVYLTVVDATRAAELEGYKVELLTAGKYKAMGSPFKPLTGDERAILQAEVDGIHADFRAAVRDGRRRGTEAGGHRTVSDDSMEGQCFDGRAALDARLVDSLTGWNLDEYVSSLLLTKPGA